MKSLNSIEQETKNLLNRATIIETKEFQELQFILEEEENILDIVKCTMKQPTSKIGILVITNAQLLLVFDGNKTSVFELELISKLDFKKGFLFAILYLIYDQNKFEFDYIDNIYIANFIDKIKAAMNNYKPQIIEQVNTENGEMSILEKLQFKKFISENSGLEGKEVETYLENLLEEEKKELILEFKKQKNIVSNNLEKPPIQQNIQIIQKDSQGENIPSCPKCGSKQVTYNKKGFSFGKAAIGGILTGGIGLLAGGIGRNKIELTCLKCGKHWIR